MKKLLYLLLVLTILGCSSNDDDSNDIDNNDNNNILVSKISYDDYELDSYSYEENFTYELNKIVQRLDVTYYNGSIQNTYRTQFIYSNDLIARVDNYDEDDNLSSRTTFQYDSQSRLTLAENCYYYNSICEQEDANSFSYNSDGTITRVSTDSYSNESEEYTYQLNNQGNIVGLFLQSDDCEEIISINYDNNNTPFKNITGANSLNVLFGGLSEGRVFGLSNNIKSIQDDIICNNSSDNESLTINFSYDYTQDGYPRNIVETVTEDGGSYTNTTILLEYN
tara:strand:+ start:139 stop:978 length:840 start_codon:yes stop_codon:yes gene_type:complete